MTDYGANSSTSLRRELAERLSSFFMEAKDGRSAQTNLGVAIATAQGPHRNRNEDRSAVIHFRCGGASSNMRLAVVCDGMGGMAMGAEAATLALSSFIAAIATTRPNDQLNSRLREACDFANRAIFSEYRGNAGTTLTAIALMGATACAIHVGDSRLYGIDAHRDVSLISQDDTISGAIKAHYGQNDEDEMDNRLLQFVGIGENLEPHLIDINLQDFEFWLLTSDGAHGVGRKTLDGICEGAKNPADLVRKLIYVSEAINTRDNATAVCLESWANASNDVSYKGLTLEIIGADRNLEIWLPSSVLNNNNIDATQKGSNGPTSRSTKTISNHGDLPRKPQAKSKSKPRRSRSKVTKDQQIPFGVVFDISEQ